MEQRPGTPFALEVHPRLPQALGRLEELARTLAAIQGTASPRAASKAVVVMAGDHGVAEEGVSAFPQEVTAQMVANFAGGGAAINVLARHVGARVVVVDMGVKAPIPGLPGVRDLRVGPGTRNFVRGPAMTREEAVRALEAGIGVASGLADDGVNVLAIGERGIANPPGAGALPAASPETLRKRSPAAAPGSATTLTGTRSRSSAARSR